MKNARKPVVLHIVTSLDFGGVETHMRIIHENSHAGNYDHRFCAIGHGVETANAIADSGGDVTLLQCPIKIPSRSALVRLYGLMRTLRPEVVHTHGSEANFHGLIAAKLAGVPVRVGEEIGIPNHSRRAQRIFRLVYSTAKCVVAISQAVKQTLVDLGEVHPTRLRVLLNPTRMLPERSAPAVSDIFEVGFVGRLEVVKNPLSLVRAVALLRCRGLALRARLVGDGSQRDLLETEISRLGLDGSVELLGFDQQPFDRLKETTLYVQPSLSEGFGIAMVEAMSAGIPVLASPVGGASEIITNGKTGWLLAGTDTEAIAVCIAELAALDRKVLISVGDAGRTSVMERFSPEIYMEQLERLYQSCASQGDQIGQPGR